MRCNCGAVPRPGARQTQHSERRSTLVSDPPGRRIDCRRTRHKAPLALLKRRPAGCRTAGDELQDEAARSAALAGCRMARNGNGMDTTSEHRTEQHKRDRRTYGTNTETAICASGWLHAGRIFVLCLAASLPTKDNSGTGITFGGCDHGLKCPVSRCQHYTTDEPRSSLPAKHWTLRDGHTDKIMATGKGGFCRSY